MIIPTPLPDLVAEQEHLTGLAERGYALTKTVPGPSEVDSHDSPTGAGEEAADPGDDQLRFGPQQQVLSELEPLPRQLPLLPDPPPWEMPVLRRPTSPTRWQANGRATRREARQVSLF